MKKRMVIPACIISLTLLFSGVPAMAASGENETEELIRRFSQETKCENVSVVISDHGEKTCFGDEEGLYQIGSMTKAFTGLAAMKLIDEGKIDEDGSVSDYIPGFEATYDAAPALITVRNLLEQKSGYTNSEKEYPGATESMTLASWADSISGRELKSKPGTEYAYSNVNYNLLGLIIENVSGLSYRDYMEKEILTPLGLDNTFARMPPEGRIVEGARLGYRHAFAFPMPVREASIPAGYFYSDAEDMGRWIDIWMGKAAVPESFCGPLSKIKGYLKEEGDYYSGWELFGDGVIGHSGGTPNYSSRIVFDEKKQVGVCVLCNLNVAATTDSLCNSILQLAAGGEKMGEQNGLQTDIWTLFDKIFTAVTGIGILLLPAAVWIRKRPLLAVLDGILILLFTLVFILFPIIFGAGMRQILFTWAPWSLTGGLLTIAGAIVAATIHLWMGRNHADRNKTGKRQTADSHH